jgi:hypothetical protein
VSLLLGELDNKVGKTGESEHGSAPDVQKRSAGQLFDELAWAAAEMMKGCTSFSFRKTTGE